MTQKQEKKSSSDRNGDGCLSIIILFFILTAVTGDIMSQLRLVNNHLDGIGRSLIRIEAQHVQAQAVEKSR